MTLLGKWINQFGSIMTIEQTDNGIFTGSYGSHTGATGNYKVVGVYDTSPQSFSQAIAFSISWRDNAAPPDPSFNWVSGFTGQLQLINGTPTISTTYLLQKNSEADANWGSTVVATATFTPYSSSESLVVDADTLCVSNNSSVVGFQLYKGDLSNNGATPWFAEVAIGNPNQRLKFMLDTGTTHTWVTSTACSTEACNLHNKFNPNNSTSFTMINPDCPPIDFGPWGSMAVELGSDQFGLSMPNDNFEQAMAFYLATQYQGSQFADLACDGGISIPSVLPSGVDSGELLPLLKSEGKINYAVAAFATDDSTGSGSCLLGGIDTSKYEGALNVVQTQRYNPFPFLWVINLNSLSCQNKVVLSNVNFALDTGSSRFKGDANYIDALIKAATLDGTLPTTQPATNPDFTQYPDLNLNINGVNYVLAAKQYFIPNQNNQFELAFHVMEGLDGLLLVGSVFLDTVYSVFYYETLVAGVQAIGLGKVPPG